MKAKSILITYLNNGNLQSQVAKEYLFRKIINDLEAEGRVLDYTAVSMGAGIRKKAKFKDGTKVICTPFSLANKGMKVTHVFIDEELAELPNGDDIVMQCKVSVINWETENFDISEKDRQFTFNFNNGLLNLKNI